MLFHGIKIPGNRLPIERMAEVDRALASRDHDFERTMLLREIEIPEKRLPSERMAEGDAVSA